MATANAELGSQADFFVHPDYHRLSGYPKMFAEVERYEAALQDKIDASALPVLIYNEDPEVQAGAFWDRFPAEHRFQTFASSGKLNDEHAKQLNQFLSEHDVLSGVVHGSYLTLCVKVFKHGIWATGGTGLLYASFDKMAREGDIYQPEAVKYGIVLDDASGTFRNYPEFQDLDRGLPPKYYAPGARIHRV